MRNSVLKLFISSRLLLYLSTYEKALVAHFILFISYELRSKLTIVSYLKSC